MSKQSKDAKRRERVQAHLLKVSRKLIASGNGQFVAPVPPPVAKLKPRHRPERIPRPQVVKPSGKIVQVGRREGWRRADGSVIYEAYIQSKAWRKRRAEFLDNAGRVCNVCRSTEHIQVHHRTYVNLGNELDRDLQALCKFCHENEHEGKVDGVMDPMTARYLALGI